MKPRRIIEILIVVLFAGGAIYLMNMGPSVPTKEEFKKAYDLALKGDDDAKDDAIGWATLEEPAIRKNAATILGYFDDEEANAALKRLLADKFEHVRLETFDAITSKRSPAREKILIDSIGAESFSDYERARLCMSLLRITKKEENKKLALDCIAKIFIETKESKAKQFSANYLAQAPIKTRELVEEFRRSAFKGNPVMMASSIRYLAFIRDEWFVKYSERLYFKKDNHTIVQKALIEVMSQTCIRNRFAAMQNFLNSKAKKVRAMMLLQMAFHNNPKTVSMLKAHLAKTTDEEEKTVARNTLKRLERGQRDRCL